MVSLLDASFGCVDGAAFDAAKDGKEVSRVLRPCSETHMARSYGLSPGCAFLAIPEVLTKLAFDLHDIEDQLYSIVFKEPLESVEWPKLEAE